MEDKIRVYLGDWFLNAGIVGFIRIITEDVPIVEQNLIYIRDNYIEFDRQALEGFSKKYFDTAFTQYGRYTRVLQWLEDAIKQLETYKSDPEKTGDVADRFKKQLNTFSLLKNKLKEQLDKIPTPKEHKKSPEKLIESLKTAITIMKKDYQEFYESDVQIYLRKIYGQKSFLNRTINSDRFKKFKTDFEHPLLNHLNKVDKKFMCIHADGRKAKANVNFDTGLSPVLGINTDSSNFLWNFKTNLPLCEICELIYFCAFAGITDVSRGNEKRFYFVNKDSSVEDLYRANHLLKGLLERQINENLLIEFFSELILVEHKKRADYALQNISFIEIDLSKEILPKVYSFNITKDKAEFINQENSSLRGLAKSSYQINDLNRNVLIDFIERFLEDRLYYDFLNRLLKVYILSLDPTKRNTYKAYYKPHILQNINILIHKYIQKVRRSVMDISDKELWFIFEKGKELAKRFRNEDAENKIPTMVYRLLNALRVGDTNTFMDVVMRNYLHYELEMPSIFVKALSDKETFYPLGYSFVNGLMEKSTQGGQSNG